MAKRLVIDLLRHGACRDGNIYRGRTDSSLSERGWAQMRAAMAMSNACRWQSVYCSSLQRCVLPAQQLAERLGLPLQQTARLREIDFGVWDGQLQEQVWEAYRPQVLAFWQDPEAHPPPDAESIQSLQQRVAAQLQQWLIDSAATPEDFRLICITHGGVIRTLLCLLLGISVKAGQQLSIDYGSMTRIELYPKDQPDCSEQPFHAQLVFVNRLPGLSDYEAKPL